MRSFAPKEHGAYAQLGLPLLGALASGTPSVAAVSLTIAAVAAFLAHEPLLVAIGRRGERAQRLDGARASQRLVLLGALAGSTAYVGAVLGGRAVALASIAPLLFAPVIAVAIARGHEKTLLGEIAAAAALSSCSVPVAIASGVTMAAALGAWASWVVALVSATFAVRGVIAVRKNPTTAFSRLARVLIAPALATSFVLMFAAPMRIVIAAAPVVVASMALAAAPPHPRSLKRVGWALVVASLLTTVLVVHGVRAA